MHELDDLSPEQPAEPRPACGRGSRRQGLSLFFFLVPLTPFGLWHVAKDLLHVRTAARPGGFAAYLTLDSPAHNSILFLCGCNREILPVTIS
jgi:hypothetical protein